MDLQRLIFGIKTMSDFESAALEVFNYQKENNPVYKEYLSLLGNKPVHHYTEIPFLPIEFFKSRKILCGDINVDVIFKSSGTTGMIRSEHYVKDANIYRISFTQTYRRFIGNPKDQVILALLPNYVEQGDSSLVFMVKELIDETNNELSGFLLYDIDSIKSRYLDALKAGKEVVIFGVSYALLDLAEKNIDLSKATIIETGGMKGKRKELTKQELHEQIKKGTGVPFVSSEYGMTELLSQAYSNSNGIFQSPDWMKILIRDVNDPFTYLSKGQSGGINVIDLANLHSCSFIATQDLGKIVDGGFEILGRFDHSDIRGCNLLVQ